MEIIEYSKLKKLNAPTTSKGGVGFLLEMIVHEALQMGASDIHLESTETDMIVRFRIDGLLRDVFLIDQLAVENFIFKIKVASKLRTDEHFAPQDGKITFRTPKGKLDLRVSIIRTSKGEKVVLRLLTSEGRSFALEDLGIWGDGLEGVKRAYNRPYGTIVVSGPTGSGKTTTLYAILKILNSRKINITTIEDPVEYDLEGVNHIQINPKANLTFAKGLRSILRQDPDIIMVGEIRDEETAKIAVNAAMTGHLVLTSLHANDAVSSVPRLIDMGIKPYLLASTLNIVIAQRLARKLCVKCRKEEKLSKERMNELKRLRPDVGNLLKEGERIFVPVGCSECKDVGYKGRIGIFEILEVTKKIRDAMVIDYSSDNLLTVAKEQKFSTMVEDAILKVKEGVTSIDEILRVTAISE